MVCVSWYLGFPDSALAAFERALPIAPTQVDKGTTLNNLSSIYQARGDYDTALRYLEASLAIQREIGDKAGEGNDAQQPQPDLSARGGTTTRPCATWKPAWPFAGDRRQGGGGHDAQQPQPSGGTTTRPCATWKPAWPFSGDGDKAGLVATLHNMGHIAWKAQNMERAMTLWSEALALARETQNAQGLFHTASTLARYWSRLERSRKRGLSCN